MARIALVDVLRRVAGEQADVVPRLGVAGGGDAVQNVRHIGKDHVVLIGESQG